MNENLLLPKISVDLVKAAKKSDSLLQYLEVDVLKNMETRYLKFLKLCMKYPEYNIAPSSDIDEMWHLHMLNPRAYYNDCVSLFGDILDHDGGFGKEAEETPILEKFFNETTSLWEQEFGEKYIPSNDSEADFEPKMQTCYKAGVDVAGI